MNVSDIEKLLNTGWGQAVLIAGIAHLLLSNKKVLTSIEQIVLKVSTIDLYITKQKVVDEFRSREIKELKEEVLHLREKVIELEKFKSDRLN